MEHKTGLYKCHAKQKHTCQGGWENRLGQCLLLKMKGLLPEVVFGGVVVGAAENGYTKYLHTFITHEVSTLGTELYASGSKAPQVG